MDPFLLNVNKNTAGSLLAVASLDSTATLPFIGLGRAADYYLGAPSNVVLALFDQDAARAELKAKIDLLERHIAALSTRITIDFNRSDEFSIFVCAAPTSGEASDA